MAVRKEWSAYYDEFSAYFSPKKIRPGCEPVTRTRSDAQGAVVLVHGLSDSPRYMWDLEEFFYSQLRYNTYLPLLHCHGLKNPAGMEDVELEEWKRNVAFAVDCAHKKTPHNVSIGGLSTGGALSYHTACTSPKVTGDLFLFSAALELLAWRSGLLGWVVPYLLSARGLNDFLDARDRDKPLVGDNPFKYDYVDKDGARELARLIKELKVITSGFSRKAPFPKRVFAAHSHCDDTASIVGIKNLQKRCIAQNFCSFYIPAVHKVSHGGLPLKTAIKGFSGSVCTPENRRFEAMTRKLGEFVGR
tara:strand:- start:438 stop:1346 length:909 start_codon:yes stop_codon:yes gene_type:complete